MTRGRPSSSSSSDTQAALIEAALAGLRADGWAALRMRNLAAAVGIRAPSIYHHYPAKADLGLALVQHLHAMTVDQVREMERVEETLDNRVIAFAALTDGTTDRTESCPAYILQAEYAILPEEMQRAVKGLVALMIDVLARWIEEARDNGEIAGDVDPRTQACVALSIAEHGQQLERVMGNVACEGMLRSWYQGLAARKN